MSGRLVFGSPEAAAVARRERIVFDLMRDGGGPQHIAMTGDGRCYMPTDHLFIGTQANALCGVGGRFYGADCRPFQWVAPGVGDAGICEACLAIVCAEVPV